MMKKGQRGMVRTGTAALGATLMAIALAVSPVGATPFTGQSSGPFESLDMGQGYSTSESLISGYDTLIGANSCHSEVEFKVSNETPTHCAATDIEVIVDFASIVCRSEDNAGMVWADNFDDAGDSDDGRYADQYACVPLNCIAPDGSLVAGCTTQMQIKYGIIEGTGMYQGSTGSFTVKGTATYSTPTTGTLSLTIEGDITLAGSAPPDGVSLDIPAPDSTQSGIGVVSGWSCLGGKLEITFSEADGTHILTWPIPHGAERKDTQGTCGDIYNGISLPINWYHLGPGAKTLALFVNGEKRLTRNFSVTTFGQEFVTDAGGMCTIADFRDGQNATFVWQQANQGLVLEALN